MKSLKWNFQAFYNKILKSDSIEIFQMFKIMNPGGWQKVFQHKGKKVISNSWYKVYNDIMEAFWDEVTDHDDIHCQSLLGVEFMRPTTGTSGGLLIQCWPPCLVFLMSFPLFCQFLSKKVTKRSNLQLSSLICHCDIAFWCLRSVSNQKCSLIISY